MPRLYFMDTGQTIGEITQTQLEFLIAQLEEEDSEDRDYYISRDTLDLFEEAGCDAELLTLLAGAMGEADGIDVAWEHTETPPP